MTLTLKQTTVFLCLCSCMIALYACQAGNKHDRIDASLKAFYNEGTFNGAILVAEKGTLLYDTAMGYADLASRKPFGPDPVFYLASLSKQFTAMAIMKLKEQHQLSYEDPVTLYFPQLPGYCQQITIRNLLNHTSGIKDYFESDTLVKPGLSNQEVFRWLMTQQTPRFAPGTQYEYSNTGYVLLSLIIEKVARKPLSRFLKETIFDPLKMSATQVFTTETPTITNRAIGYQANGKLDDYTIRTTGDGGIFSTTHDLLLWDQALRNHQLLEERVQEEAFTGPLLKDGSRSDYGFGWSIAEKGKDKVVYHTGELNGYQTLIWRDLNSGVTIIVLTNKGNSFRMWPVTNKILKILGSKRFVE